MARFCSEPSLAEGYKSISDKQNRCGLTFLKEISLNSGAMVLDMGCGTGYLASVMAECVGGNGKVIAVDPDAGRIKVGHTDRQLSYWYDWLWLKL